MGVQMLPLSTRLQRSQRSLLPSDKGGRSSAGPSRKGAHHLGAVGEVVEQSEYFNPTLEPISH